MQQPIMVTAHCTFRKEPGEEVAAQIPSLGRAAFGNTTERARRRLGFLLGNLLQHQRPAGILEDFLELNCSPNGGSSHLLARWEGLPTPEGHPARRLLQKDVGRWPTIEVTPRERRITAGA